MAATRPRSRSARPATAVRAVPAAGGDIGALLKSAAEEAARLLSADGAILYLMDPDSGYLRFTHAAGIAELPPGHRIRELLLPMGVGMFGKAVADRGVVVTGDYASDERFVHVASTDSFNEELGIRSLVVAPLSAGDEVFGALGTFSRALDAFTEPQIGLVRALADHAALAMANARLIEQLARSREAIEHQATIERSLRELGTRISGARDPGAVVQHTIDEALRLLGGDGARIDIVDAEIRQLRGLYSAGDEQILETEWPRDPDDRLEVGVSGRAVTTGRTYISPDYLPDPNLVHSMGPDTYARSKGIRGVIATPLFGDEGPFGAITIWSTRADAFSPEAAALLETIAGQAAVALGRARLIEALGESREALARRAEEERALREIGSRLGAMGDDPADVLQRIVHETARLLGAERARLHLLEPLSEAWLWTYPPGMPFNDRIVGDELTPRPPGAKPIGLAGLAIAEGRPVVSTDYLADTRFDHYTEGDSGVRVVGLRSIVAAPVTGDRGLLGVLQAGHREAGAFGEDAVRLIGALASQASIAITNARLVDRLASSQAALSRTADAERALREEAAQRAETERALREIAARITAIRDPDIILGLIVDETRRVLGSDGAHLTRMSEDRTFVRPVVVAGGLDTLTRDWLQVQEFPINGGINGLAAGQGRVVWTPDYATDPRVPRDEDDLDVAERMGLGALAAAPLHAPGGDIIGTLSVSYRRTGTISADRLATLQALADHAAIALSNSDLLARLEASEANFRGLVQATPDVIWRSDADGRFTFMAEGAEHLFGWKADELVGRRFVELVAADSHRDAVAAWARLASTPGEIWRLRFLLAGRDGTRFPAEVSAATTFEGGVFRGAQGTLRDISERERLERDLRESEERYRYLVQSSPDLVWMTDRDGRFTFVSDQAAQLIGWDSKELLGRSFADLAPSAGRRAAIAGFRWLQRRPTVVYRSRINVLTRDGRELAMEITGVGMVQDEDFIGAHGAARDISERDRLERGLRRQAAQLASSEERAHLARELHDSVTQALFSMTLLSRSIELLLDRDPSQVPEKLALLRDLQREALAEMRALIFELRPGNIEETGLIEALRTHSASLSGRVGLPVVVEADLAERPPLDVEEALYRIAQEALHNVVKHSGARQVRVQVGRVAGGVLLRVVDDGRGFDPAAVPDGHLGLAGMLARAERLGGRLTVTTAPGHGTTIEVVAPETGPLDESDDDA